MEPPHFPELEPVLHDDDDVDGAFLPGFAALRRRTYETLYHGPHRDDERSSSSTLQYADRSPKGSVDEPIRSLVDLINAHPAYATLSSCSGRISVYDAHLYRDDETKTTPRSSETEEGAPRQQQRHDHDDDDERDAYDRQHHGKGGTGGWLLAAHAAIDVEQVLRLIQSSSSSSSTTTDEYDDYEYDDDGFFTRSLRFEPFLLHVAAADLRYGRDLLASALRTGFRESGLIVTDRRVTVAVRSYGLSCCVPLLSTTDDASSSSSSYLRRVLRDCNTRLRRNHVRLQRFRSTVRRDLFVPRRPNIVRIRSVDTVPPLRLWGHAAVVVTVSSDECRTTGGGIIHVFGGYGTGPAVSGEQDDDDDSPSPTQCQRSASHVYRLITTTNDDGRSHRGRWERVIHDVPRPSSPSSSVERRIHGVPVVPASWTGRQGLAAAVWRSDTVVLVGGRRGPHAPVRRDGSSPLLFFHRDAFWRPLDADRDDDDDDDRSTPAPCPRWGHSLTALPDGHRFVVMGGCTVDETTTTTTTLDDVHVLDLSEGVVRWTRGSMTLPAPRCFHAAAAIGDDQVLVTGGTGRARELLPAADAVPDAVLVHVDANATTARIVTSPTTTTGLLGHALVGVGRRDLIQIGGVGADDTDWIQCFSWDATKERLERHAVTVSAPDNGGDAWNPDGTLLVHHAAVCLASCDVNSTPTRIVTVGGGVQGFAFGHVFADSLVLDLEWEYACTRTDRPTWPAAADKARPPNPKGKGTTGAGAPTETSVFYVRKRNAKTFKSQLESHDLLDKTYRISAAVQAASQCPTPADAYVAVPVRPRAIALWNADHGPDWLELAEGMGTQEVMLSSSAFARRARTSD